MAVADSELRKENALYPRSVKAASRPLPIHRILFQLVQNPLRIVPEEAYREPIVIRGQAGAYGKAAWVTDPALIETLLVQNASKIAKSPLEKRVLGRSLGDGILTSDGALWRWQRRTMAPLFRAVEISGYVPVMSTAAEEQVRRWREAGPGWKRVDKDMTRTTFAVIAATMLAGGESAETEAVKTETERYLSYVSWEIAFTLLNMPRWLPHPGSLAMRRSAANLRASIKSIIDKRRAGAALERPEEDLLSRLVAARDPDTGDPMPEARLIDNLLTLLEAGHETTAKALTWTFYLLARAPEWQTAVRREIKKEAGNDKITAAHLPKLALTQQVLKESMRLYPPAPSMVRIFIEPCELGGHRFERGDMAIFPIFCIHRHRRLWTDPDRFDPARFSPEREKTYSRTQFMPFGAGPRICLGNAFAMAEATAILATVLREVQFDWAGGREPEPISRITLRPRGGMRLLVTPLPD
ncbi:MAG TPA: cytochrome P450 [Hyphomicrobiales bacterium]|nr:cytochrome P450 [Hyphomicrobiales bacterium]